jgi:hypothetical protein
LAVAVEFPHESVATHLMSVVPTGKTEPEGGLQTTEGAGSQLSVAVGVA